MEDKRPIVDKTTGISIGLALLLAALIVGWTTNDAAFKSEMSSSMESIQVSIAEIKAELAENQDDIIDLKVRVALLERELEEE
jgi:hypothetical protein